MCRCGCGTCGIKGPTLTNNKFRKYISTNLQRYIDNQIPLRETKELGVSTLNEARKLYSRGVLNLSKEDVKLIKETKEPNYYIIKVNGGKRLGIIKKDLMLLKNGKNIIGKSLKHTGQEEWVIPKYDKWELEGPLNETKSESTVYELFALGSTDTSMSPQHEIFSDIRSIEGVTTISFIPKNENETANKNPNYEGKFIIKIDNFPFSGFKRKKHIKDLIKNIQSIPAINKFKPLNLIMKENKMKELNNFKKYLAESKVKDNAKKIIKKYLAENKLLKEERSETHDWDTGELDVDKIERFIIKNFPSQSEDFEEILGDYIDEISSDSPEYNYNDMSSEEILQDFNEFADERGFNLNEDRKHSLKENIFNKIKNTLLGKKNSDKFEDDEVAVRPNDEERKIAHEFAKRQKSGVASIGVNNSDGSINIELDNGKQFILDKNGKVIGKRYIDWRI